MGVVQAQSPKKEAALRTGSNTPRWEALRFHQAAMGGAGELSAIIVSPPSMPLLLRSLATALLSLGLRSLEPVVSLLTSPAKPESRWWVFHDGILQSVPVKDLSWTPLRSQRRQGLPVRSRARRLALMLPVFAFGPSLCAGTGLGPVEGPFLPSCERSMVPSGLL